MSADTTDDLPPSAKAIRVTLKLAGPCSWTELKNHTRLPDATLNDGLNHLEAAGRLSLQSDHEGPDRYVLSPTPNTGANC